MSQPLRRLALWLGIGVTVALGAAALWLTVGLPVLMMRQVGLSGWRPESGRECADPSGMSWRHCHAAAVHPAGGQRVEERISLSRRTRSITWIERDWWLPDSSQWAQQQDSVGLALLRRGGGAIECPAPSGAWSDLAVVKAWRFPEQEVRLLAYRRTGNTAAGTQWGLQLTGSPIGQSGCQASVRTQRLLTLPEMMGAVQRWFEERTD